MTIYFLTTKQQKMLIETTKKITTGHYLVTDPSSEFHGQTLKVQSGVYGHLGQQIGVCLEYNEHKWTKSFLWAQIVRAEPITIQYNYAIQERLPCKGLKVISYALDEMKNAAKYYARLQRQPIIYTNLKTTFNFTKIYP